MGETGSAAGGWISRLRSLAEPALVVFTVGGLVAGGLAWLAGWRSAADGCWIAGTVLALAPALVWVLIALRRGRFGVDVIAVLSLIGTLVVGEYLAGALIAVMLAGGRALDAAAQRRASRDLRALLERAPRFARRRIGTQVGVIPLAEVTVNDILVVGPGEVVPVDGRIADVVAVLDESALTGEPLQVERAVGEPVRSGVVNAGSAFELRATATADQSTYAGIVRMAQRANADNAPIVRLADRYAAWFLPLVLLVAGAAWFASGSAVRAVAVLVVATPCPLLLAAPVAIVSGLCLYGLYALLRLHFVQEEESYFTLAEDDVNNDETRCKRIPTSRTPTRRQLLTAPPSGAIVPLRRPIKAIQAARAIQRRSRRPCDRGAKV